MYLQCSSVCSGQVLKGSCLVAAPCISSTLVCWPRPGFSHGLSSTVQCRWVLESCFRQAHLCCTWWAILWKPLQLPSSWPQAHQQGRLLTRLKQPGHCGEQDVDTHGLQRVQGGHFHSETAPRVNDESVGHHIWQSTHKLVCWSIERLCPEEA